MIHGSKTLNTDITDFRCIQNIVLNLYGVLKHCHGDGVNFRDYFPERNEIQPFSGGSLNVVSYSS